MGRIRFYMVYTDLVEHYLRLGVRYEKARHYQCEDWHKFTKEWLSTLDTEDNLFLNFIFGSRFRRTDFGLYEYVHPGNERLEKEVNYEFNRQKLFGLERKFAVDAGLINEKEFPSDTGCSQL